MFKKAKDITAGETVFDRGQSFIVKEVRVDQEHGWIAFMDTQGLVHGWYHPEEYLGVNINSQNT
jgi:hypothetical protein